MYQESILSLVTKTFWAFFTSIAVA
jgi:hypothetical protein